MTSGAPSASIQEGVRKLHQAKRNALARYEPYPKQAEFHAAGSKFRERALLAGNQSGKTWSASYEVAMHLTGLYPEWWQGRRFAHPVVGWAGNQSTELTRDNPQRLLMGPSEDFGTGSIPADCLHGMTRMRGMADALDTVKVRHVSGGVSTLKFKSYDQGALKWSGATLHFVWLDEEPDTDIYSECLARTNRFQGSIFLTVTPLLGMTEVIGYYYPSPNTEARHLTMMELQDALHYSPDEIQKMVDAWPPHEREARSKGVPRLGEGRVFAVEEGLMMEDPFDIPRVWPRICGMDFGYEHPTAAVWLAWDRDADVLHLYDCYAQSRAVPAIHAAAVKARGDWIPVAWPHDAYRHDPGSGESLADQYRAQGLSMLPTHAQEKGFGRRGLPGGHEAVVQEMLEFMQTGRFKVARHLERFWREFRTYHRKDGKIFKERDDVLDAARYAFKARRFARVQELTAVAETVGMDYDPFDDHLGG